MAEEKPFDENDRKIGLGICVSPLTVERCGYCVDRCRASEVRTLRRELNL